MQLAETIPDVSKHVVVVDDDEAVARLATRMLTGLGHRVTSFLRPEKALQSVVADPSAFDVLVTDNRMPGMTGQELVLRLHAAGSALPALIVSGYSDEIDREALSVAGPSEILDKPFTKEEMKLAIENLTGPETAA